MRRVNKAQALDGDKNILVRVWPSRNGKSRGNEGGIRRIMGKARA